VLEKCWMMGVLRPDDWWPDKARKGKPVKLKPRTTANMRGSF